MEAVAIVTCLALAQFVMFAIQVGQQRVRHEIGAPATSGHPDFERAFRVHMNTMEQLVVFLPSLWMFAFYWRPEVAAAIGLVFIAGRQLYRNAYMTDPAKRSPGFGIGFMATAALLIGGLVGAVLRLA